ncbi:unnamed protein product [Ilex paraguariensis]|uniref:Uncharacterized protein n=1 Tax=Ilex paraguariensis TaxID=185542 RepID=A0ABC8QVU4_9AQUA
MATSNLKRLEAQSMEEGATPMTEDQRFEAVLGPKNQDIYVVVGLLQSPQHLQLDSAFVHN